MKLPKFFRRFTPIAAIAVGVAMVARIFFGATPPDLLSTLSGFAFEVALFVLAFSFIGMLVARDVENALIRRFGEPATATVLAIEPTNESVNRVGVYRLKLQVQPAQAESFVAVAENAIRIVNMPDTGNTVPVKYDPRTREVALEMPGTIKTKTEDF